MTYKKLDLQDGEVLTADHLEHIESGIARVSEDIKDHKNDTTTHVTAEEKQNWDNKSEFSGSYNDLTNKPTIPDLSGYATEDYVGEQINALEDRLQGDLSNIGSDIDNLGIDLENHADDTSIHVSESEKEMWNEKSDFSGSYDDLTDKPNLDDYATHEEVRQLSSEIANKSGYVAQPNAPTDTSAIWIDTDDDYDDGFSEAVLMALREAKASGEFDGKDGTNGKNGYTPIKGTDYFTAEEKAEMVNAVLTSLPVYSGEVI